MVLNGIWISISCLARSAHASRHSADCRKHWFKSSSFITPILWLADGLGPHRWLAEINPTYAASDVLRAALLGQPYEPHSWSMLLAVTVLGCIGAFAFFARFRTRIAFWV